MIYLKTYYEKGEEAALEFDNQKVTAKTQQRLIMTRKFFIQRRVWGN